MQQTLSPQQAAKFLKEGRIVAYPTEAVYGLGVDPQNETALAALLQAKGRRQDKGLIVVAATFEQLVPYIAPIDDACLARVLASWPGPHTWIFPAKPQVSSWLTGGRDTIAVRVSTHPVVRQLCEAFDGAIVSTSANISNAKALRTPEAVLSQFGNEISGVVAGALGDEVKPTSITDVRTGEKLR